MAIGDTKFSVSADPDHTSAPTTAVRHASWGKFAIATVVSSAAICLIALVDFVWSLTGLQLWFIIPAGQMLVGMGIGGLYWTTYRMANGLPSARDLIACGLAAVVIFLGGEWFHYRVLTIEKDGQNYSVSKLISFEDFYELQFHGKRQLRFGRGGQIRGPEFDANPGYEKFLHAFGFLVLAIAAGGTFASLTRGQRYCEKCQKYFKSTKSITIKFSSPDDLISRLTKSDAAGFGSSESIQYLLSPFADSTPERKRRLILTLSSLKCPCGRQIFNQNVFKLESKAWKQISELTRSIEFPPGNPDIGEIIDLKAA